jgi:hypothetical protein
MVFNFPFCLRRYDAKRAPLIQSLTAWISPISRTENVREAVIPHSLMSSNQSQLQRLDPDGSPRAHAGPEQARNWSDSCIDVRQAQKMKKVTIY